MVATTERTSGKIGATDDAGDRPADAVIAAIRDRRSVGKVGPERPPRETIERLLEAATWAPNHHLTQPWRFTVLAGEERAAFGQAMAQALVGTPNTPEEQAAYDRSAAKALRAPVIIVAAIDPGVVTTSVELEEYAAGAAAVQNLLLAAHELGLGAIWRTGAAAFHPDVKAHVGLGPTAHILGFVYLGYPVAAPPTRERVPADALTTWRGWDGD